MMTTASLTNAVGAEQISTIQQGGKADPLISESLTHVEVIAIDVKVVTGGGKVCTKHTR